LPGRALHQFDDANHFATHSFVFENEPANALPLADSLRITSRRRMLDESKHLEIPITIDVPELADTIPSLPPVN
jgi:hypothetical protein